MAAKAIVAERQGRAIESIRQDVKAIIAYFQMDSIDILVDVKGDERYREMVRTEQIAELMKVVKKRVVPASLEATSPEPELEPAPVEVPQPVPEPEPVEPEPEADADDDEDEEPPQEEPVIHGHTLSYYDGKSDAQILALKGVGQGTLKKIREAQEERDAG